MILDRISDDLVSVHQHDYRAADLSELSNVPVQTNGDEDHYTDAGQYRFQMEVDPLANMRDLLMCAIAHQVADRPRLLRNLATHKFRPEDTSSIDPWDPNALHQLRCIRIADLLLARDASVIGPLRRQDPLDSAISMNCVR